MPSIILPESDAGNRSRGRPRPRTTSALIRKARDKCDCIFFPDLLWLRALLRAERTVSLRPCMTRPRRRWPCRALQQSPQLRKRHASVRTRRDRAVLVYVTRPDLLREAIVSQAFTLAGIAQRQSHRRGASIVWPEAQSDGETAFNTRSLCSQAPRRHLPPQSPYNMKAGSARSRYLTFVWSATVVWVHCRARNLVLILLLLLFLQHVIEKSTGSAQLYMLSGENRRFSLWQDSPPTRRN